MINKCIQNSALEQDTVIGVFTHRTTYLEGLLESIKKHLPGIQLIVQLADIGINENMEALRQKFKSTNKRFWVFLDDDIKFLSNDIIHKATLNLIKHKFAAVGVYSTFDPMYEEKNNLECKEISWIPGYFMMIDSRVVGDIKPDLNLPDANTSVDTSYCVSIKAKGYKIGISPSVVYHYYKQVISNEEIVKKTNEYLTNKWGNFYFQNIVQIDNIVGSIPNHAISLESSIINTKELENNKQRLIKWQQEQYSLKPNRVGLNVGSGNNNMTGFINVDYQKKTGDLCCNLKTLSLKPETIDDITCQHVLEHLYMNDVDACLKEFYRILKSGGLLDIGVPDIKLLGKELSQSTGTVFDYALKSLYGCPDENKEINEAMAHKSGFTQQSLNSKLEAIGFSVLETYQYNGNDTPSVFTLAEKR